MAKKLALSIAALMVVFAGVIATRPADFSISRSLKMDAPPEVVAGFINDFHAWDKWSPWDALDPNQKKTYQGPASGVGAITAWKGEKTGEGRMTLTQAMPTQTNIKLEFIKPMTATHETVFQFQPEGPSTLVTWTMSGTHDFMGKAFSLFMDMDKMIGADFEKGLADLKPLADAEAKRLAAEPPTAVVGEDQVPPAE
jgi:hypothetical protein